MEKRAIFSGKLVPYLLLLPQLAITVIFFYWPASQAVWQSFLMEDAFGLSSEFVGFEIDAYKEKLASGEERPFAHPYAWATFQVLGRGHVFVPGGDTND